MRVPKSAVNIASSLITPVAIAFLQNSITVMVPWLITMLTVVLADLVAGVRKAMKMGVHVSFSRAIRDTMGKLVVYVAFVFMVSMIDTASGREFSIAEWSCLLVCLIEGCSVISNILKPHGIDISLRTILELFVQKVLHVTKSDSETIIKKSDDEKDV
jgi:hypothetical protein